MEREIVDSVKMLLGNEDRIIINGALLHWACSLLLWHDSRPLLFLKYQAEKNE